jgi:hypothetical protein
MMVVAAVEGYSIKQGLSPAFVFGLFKEKDVFSAIRGSYEALHTQSLDESVTFAEDVLLQRLA